jgi:hypothetical protein
VLHAASSVDLPVLLSTATSAYKVISSVAGSSGSIAPIGEQTVQAGGTATFTLTPDAGYKIADAGVGGTCGGTLSGGSYKTNPVIADCTVIASFAPIADVEFSVDAYDPTQGGYPVAVVNKLPSQVVGPVTIGLDANSVSAGAALYFVNPTPLQCQSGSDGQVTCALPQPSDTQCSNGTCTVANGLEAKGQRNILVKVPLATSSVLLSVTPAGARCSTNVDLATTTCK